MPSHFSSSLICPSSIPFLNSSWHFIPVPRLRSYVPSSPWSVGILAAFVLFSFDLSKALLGRDGCLCVLCRLRVGSIWGAVRGSAGGRSVEGGLSCWILVTHLSDVWRWHYLSICLSLILVKAKKSSGIESSDDLIAWSGIRCDIDHEKRWVSLPRSEFDKYR